MKNVSLSAVLKTCALIASFVLYNESAASTPLQQQIEQGGSPVYSNLAKANHVFGYQFKVMEVGLIDQVGGHFTGTKNVVIVDDSNQIVASQFVSGDASDFVWSTLDSPLQVKPGQVYRVLVRAGTDQSSAAVWSVNMPFTRDGVRVLTLQQGWSANPDPAVWVRTARTLGDQQARGLIDIRFRASTQDDSTTPIEPVDPIDNPIPDVPPIAGDPYPLTVGVVDSFGQAPPGGKLGMGFMAVRAYYQNFKRLPGECSIEVHDRYWVRDENGVTHPTWHPAYDETENCVFAHEHGDDPRLSPNYTFAQGVPFGMTHGSGQGTPGGDGFMRHEDHVGHKVVVQNSWGLVDGNPQQNAQPNSAVIRRTGINCDWLSKIHQGSWSRDALANNAHEYFLNLRCDDGVQLRLKQLVTFGPPGQVTNMCDNTPVGPAGPNSSPNSTSQRFPSGIAATSGTDVVKALDGKREFACLKNLMGKERLEELWKSDGIIDIPGGGFINFSPYYAVLNPARYMDHQWFVRNATDSYISSIDLCFDDNPVYRGRPMGFCKNVPTALGNLSTQDRQRDIRNPMNGTQRVIHPKEIIVYTQYAPGSDNVITFCTNRLGRNAHVPDSGVCNPGEIEQRVSRSDRRQYNWKGSDVNSINVNSDLRGAGYLNEWVRDYSQLPGIRFPN